MTNTLRTRALEAVVAIDPQRTGNHKLRAIKYVADAIVADGQERPNLRAIADAVDWALAQPRDFSQYLADWQNTPSYWRQYMFPNGRAVNVEVDPRIDASAFRFVVEYDGEDGMFTAPGLSTGEVEAKLAEIAAMPAITDAA